MNGEVGGRGGAVEDGRGGVGRPSAVQARGVLGCPDPLPVGLFCPTGERLLLWNLLLCGGTA